MQSIKLINGKEHQQEAEGCLVDTGVGAAHIILLFMMFNQYQTHEKQ